MQKDKFTPKKEEEEDEHKYPRRAVRSVGRSQPEGAQIAPGRMRDHEGTRHDFIVIECNVY